MFKLISIMILSISFAFSQATDYVQMGASSLKIEGKNYLAISLDNDEGWHTYWKNPGDAGLELKFKFKINNQDIILTDLPWPTPKRYIEQGTMWAYGYSNQYAFFYELPEETRNQELNIVGTWLVCKDICIPGTKTVNLNLGDFNSSTSHTLPEKELTKIFERLPSAASNPKIDLYLTKGYKDNQLALHYIIEDYDLALHRKSSNIITPYLKVPLDYKHEEIYYDENSKTLFGRTYIEWDGIYEEPIWNLPTDGVFKTELITKFLFNYPNNQNSKIITKSFKEFTLTGDAALTEKFKTLMLLDEKTSLTSAKGTTHTEEKTSLFVYLLFAFLGGLILNLMPCVLPVISLKLFGLIVHSDESKSQVLKHNLAYTFGVVSSFMVLATVVVLFKQAGQQIGWGFQMQSPGFLFFMILVLFIMALNMFGLFEFVTPGGNKLGNTQVKKGIGADFLNGVIATILSTPCSAPFLSAALSFAFTTSVLNSYLIFIFVGIGLSFPFLLTGFFPALIRFLPKPGVWMEKLKYFLGLSLLLTTIWLIDVLFGIVDFSIIGLFFNTTIALIFFTFFLRKYISKKVWITILLSLLTLFMGYKTSTLFSHLASETLVSKSGNQNWEAWSLNKMKAPHSGLTFVNFTAKWCLTCKVNKKLVLESEGFKKLVEEKNIRLLEADWTKRDDNITEFLSSYGIVGVPAYFAVKENGEVINLGETITVSKVRDL